MRPSASSARCPTVQYPQRLLAGEHPAVPRLRPFFSWRHFCGVGQIQLHWPGASSLEARRCRRRRASATSGVLLQHGTDAVHIHEQIARTPQVSVQKSATYTITIYRFAQEISEVAAIAWNWPAFGPKRRCARAKRGQGQGACQVHNRSARPAGRAEPHYCQSLPIRMRKSPS